MGSRIEVGKFYKGLNGLKCLVTGEHIPEMNEGYPYSIRVFKDNGEFYPDRCSSVYLVEEWEEPRPRMRAYIERGFGETHGSAKFYPEDRVPNDSSSFRYERAPWLDEPEVR